jgi:CheY-like chemotaxis protein
MLSRIFDLFEQSSRSLDRSEGGLGIGLTLARRLAHLHGGTLTAHSDGLGLGSELVLRLPFLADPEPTRPDPAGAECDPPPRYRIVVVDDNVDAAEMLATVLQLGGHEVHIGHDGLAALELVGSVRPDIAFVDLGLPGLDGFELAQQLREHPHRPGLRLVAVTGYGQEDDRIRSREAGFDHHMTKPVAVDELLKWLSGPLEDAP